MADIRHRTDRSKINVFLDDGENPAFIVSFNPYDPNNAVRLNNIDKAITNRTDSADLESIANITQTITQNIDAMTDAGTAELIFRHDTSGDNALLADIMTEMGNIIKKTTAERDAVKKKYIT